MSKEYVDIIDHMISLLGAERTDALSEDLSTALLTVNKGMYTATGHIEKPCLFVRVGEIGNVSLMGGGLQRQCRLLLAFSGATSGTTQATVHDDCMKLINNLENFLMHYDRETDYWWGGMFGWTTGSDEDPERYVQIIPDYGQDRWNYVFQVLWSCNARIARTAL